MLVRPEYTEVYWRLAGRLQKYDQKYEDVRDVISWPFNLLSITGTSQAASLILISRYVTCNNNDDVDL